MKKTASALTLILALLFSAVAGTQFVDLTLAIYNTLPPFYPATPDMSPPSITIQSPQNLQTYDVSIVPYSVTIEKPSSWYENNTHSWLSSVGYIIDGGKTVTIADGRNFNSSLPDVYSNSAQVISFEGNLSGLSEGSHNFQVWAQSFGYYNPDNPRNWLSVHEYSFFTYSSTVLFIVPLRVSILSLENKTYDTSDVSLNFTVNTSASEITYSIDGQKNVTIAGNTTLTGLANGNHNLTVYAKDAAWKIGASETMHFNVEVPEVPEPFPTTSVVASIASAAIITAGLLFYFRKRNHARISKL